MLPPVPESQSAALPVCRQRSGRNRPALPDPGVTGGGFPPAIPPIPAAATIPPIDIAPNAPPTLPPLPSVPLFHSRAGRFACGRAEAIGTVHRTHRAGATTAVGRTLRDSTYGDCPTSLTGKVSGIGTTRRANEASF